MIPVEKRAGWRDARAITLLGRRLERKLGTLMSEDWRLRAFPFEDESESGWQATAMPALGQTYVQLSGRGSTLEEAEEELRASLRSARDLAEELLEDEPIALVVSDDHGRAATLGVIAELVADELADPEQTLDAIRTRLAEHHPELTEAR